VLPADCAWNDGGEVVQALAAPHPPSVESTRIEAAARTLALRQPTVLMLSGAALGEAGLRQAHRIAHATGARLMAPSQVPYLARGRGRPAVERVPYAVDAALKTLAGTRHLVLAAAKAPVAFFGYPGKPSEMWPKECELLELARADEDVVMALEQLADALGAPQEPPLASAPLAPAATGAFSPDAFARTFATLIPDNAIVADDAVTSGRTLFSPTAGSAPHHWMQVTGGSIGYAFPSATGAAIAAPSRKVVCLQADGGGMYSLQALWTQAREKLDVVNVVFANRRYAILQGELAAVGATPGRASNELFDIGRPDLDWVKLAGGMGVEATRVDSLEGFAEVFRGACARRGPFLIEFAI
jgi:acetolactate synthase-1/2/3 large subunit